MPIINAKKLSLATIRKPLADLLIANKTYLNGQWVIAIDDNGFEGVKVGDWNWETDDISAGTPFAARPWLIRPEASGSAGFSPFKVRNTDIIAGQDPYYQVIDGKTVITDSRLKGIADPIVSTTQINSEFRDTEMIVDNAAGTITFPALPGLEDGEHISVFVPANITSEGTSADLLARVQKLEALTAPILAGALMWWPFALGGIPDGWSEATWMRGYFPMHYIPGDATFGNIGHTGGSTAKFTVAKSNIQAFDVNLPTNPSNFGATGTATYVGVNQGAASASTITIGVVSPTPIDKMNPYLIGMWITYAPPVSNES